MSVSTQHVVTTANKDGSTTISVTNTQVSFSSAKGSEGKVLSSTTQASSFTWSKDGTKMISKSEGPVQNVSVGDAGKLIAGGATNIGQVQQSAHAGTLGLFPGRVAHDMKTHPFRAIGRALAIGALTIDPPTTLAGAALAAGSAGADFGESMQHSKEEQ